MIARLIGYLKVAAFITVVLIIASCSFYLDHLRFTL